MNQTSTTGRSIRFTSVSRRKREGGDPESEGGSICCSGSRCIFAQFCMYWHNTALFCLGCNLLWFCDNLKIRVYVGLTKPFFICLWHKEKEKEKEKEKKKEKEKGKQKEKEKEREKESGKENEMGREKETEGVWLSRDSHVILSDSISHRAPFWPPVTSQ